MSFQGSAATNNDPPVPKPLQLALDPENGSLLTAPLTHVLLTATDGLYSDLYNMAHGELNVVVTSAAADTEAAEENNDNNNNTAATTAAPTTKLERMSNLSFAQRRHELAWRLARHGKTLQHVAALTAAAATTDLSPVVQVASRALQHARTAWVQADEAQDALYFFHAQLFPSRAPPQDVYGAADLMQRPPPQPLLRTTRPEQQTTTTTGGAAWYDLCRDLQLLVDPYDTSPEASWSAHEVDERWQLAVRRKLLAGEVGWMQQQQRRQQQQEPVLWKVSLRGGLVRLVQGQGKKASGANKNDTNHNSSTTTTTSVASDTDDYIYPIEALLTVIPSHQQQPQLQPRTRQQPEWTLLSLDVRVQPKTGEFNYQLEASNRQRYDLHRLASLAMSREEARARWVVEQQQQQENDAEKDEDAMDIDHTASNNNPTHTLPGSSSSAAARADPSTAMARPLQALFQVAHHFSLSWQLEVLSAQAQGLRRGVWAAAASSSNAINVMPVRFFLDDNHRSNVLGVVSIAFWKVDDSYGPPSLGDLSLDNDENAQKDGDGTIRQQPQHEWHPIVDQQYRTPEFTSQLVLSIRAEANVGIKVALSGASSVLSTISTDPRVRSTVQELMEATSNPFALSASDALLAATRLCAERKCYAVVQALQQSLILPCWVALSVEHGSIAVATRVQYYGLEETKARKNGSMPILFRLMCDARTGSFVPTFPRAFKLLQQLACNDVHASEPVAIRIASLPPNRRRAAGANTSGRCVRDAFGGLIRSMNALGYRTGVGGTWDDLDQQSSLLRQRSIQSACADVRTSLLTCCAMSALFGLAPVAMASAVGLDATPDMTGKLLESVEGIKLVAVPPLSIRLGQELIQASAVSAEGKTKRSSHVEKELFSLSCSISDNGVILVPMEFSIKLDNPGAHPLIKTYELLRFEAPKDGEALISNGNCDMPISNGGKSLSHTDALLWETQYFSELLSYLIDRDDDEEMDK